MFTVSLLDNALDLLVDGELITDALVLEQTSEGEQLIYAGKGSLKELHEALTCVIKNFKCAEYCIICYINKKYITIRITPKKYLILSAKRDLPAEQYIAQLLDLFDRLCMMFGGRSTEHSKVV